MSPLFSKSTPSLFCLFFTLFSVLTPLFAQTPAIEAAEKALEIAKRDTANALPYATSLRDMWQAYRNYLIVEKQGTPDTLRVLLLTQDTFYRLSMDSLVKVSAGVKGKALRKVWGKIAKKEEALYLEMAESVETFEEYHYGDIGDTPKSLPYSEFALALYTKIKLNYRNDYFQAVNGLAIIYGDVKKYELSLSLLDKAIVELNRELERFDSLTQREKEKPENEWLKKARLPYTNLMTRACAILHEKGDMNAAIVAGKKAIVVLKKTLKDTSYKATDFSSSNPYSELARTYNADYKPDSAILLCNESLAYFPKYANYFNLLIIAYQLKGDMVNFKKTALESYELAQNINEKTLAEGFLFAFYLKIGQYTEARKWLDKSDEDILKQYGEHSYLGGAFPNYLNGVFYTAVGEFDKAELHINKSITIQKDLGYDLAAISGEHSELIKIYNALGQYDKSLNIQRQVQPPLYENSRISGLYWETLGDTYQKMEQLDSAQNCYEKSYAIFKTGQKTIEFARSNYKLGYVAESKHDFATAEKWYKEAQTYIDSIELTDPANKVLCLLSHSGLLRKCGQYPESLEKSEKSLNILRGLENTSNYHKAQLNRALLHDAQQQNTAAIDSLQSLWQNIETRIVKEFGYLSEPDKVAFMTMLDGEFFGTMQAAFARLYAKGEAAKSGALFYNTALLQKELSLVDTRSLKRKASNLNDTLLFAKLFKLNAFEEQIKSDKPIPTVERERLVTEITQIKADLEKTYPQLFEKEWLKINWQSIKQKLKKGDIAIEFADVLNNDDDTTSIRNYYAVIVKADSEYPTLVPLFEEHALIRLLDSTVVYKHFPRVGLSDSLKIDDAETVKKRYNKEYGKKLYDLIWQPLENTGILRGVKTVHFAPSGLLNRINISALPIVRDSIKRLMEMYQLLQYNTTRSIVESTTQRNTSARDLVLFGDIQFGNCENDSSTTASVDTNMEANVATNLLVTRSGFWDDSTRIKWAYLKNGKAEVEQITRIQKTQQPNAAFTSWTGFAATEAQLKSCGSYGKPSPSIVYISTHGYGNPSHYPESRYATGPLHRAGLVMATANWTTYCPIQRAPNEDNGIITAYEISQLNLSNTELVVLNGCQTGLGDIWGREGVFGLTRGFKLAGARYIIASLWEVPDAQAATFMTAFYAAYQSEKNGKRLTVTEAFKQTQKDMMQKQSVYSWAAWVLVE